VRYVTNRREEGENYLQTFLFVKLGAGNTFINTPMFNMVGYNNESKIGIYIAKDDLKEEFLEYAYKTFGAKNVYGAVTIE
jgi:hypothetical protein